MQELRGKPVADKLVENLKINIIELREQNIIPTLAVVRVGNREDDIAYENSIIKRFSVVEAAVQKVLLPEDCSQEMLEETIKSLNENSSVHGILLFRPLPGHLTEEPIKIMIASEKDVDCIGLTNTAYVFTASPLGYPPCTAQAVIELLDYYGIVLAGKKAIIVGRSMVVGKPLAMLLLSRNATVTVCHTKTLNLAEECKNADILIACAGSKRLIKKDFVNPAQIVVDVGVNMDEGKLYGDVNYEETAEIVKAITPVPGGVGTVTTSVLLKHTIMNAVRASKLE